MSYKSSKSPRYTPDVEEHYPSTPEQDLWLSALILGVYRALRQNDQKELDWINSNRMYVGSFRWICQSCQICPEILRNKLLVERIALRPETEQPQRIIQGFYRFNTRPKKPRLSRRPGFYTKRLRVKP